MAKRRKNPSAIKQDRALKVAYEVLGDHLSLRRLHDSLQELVKNEHVPRITKALDPKAAALENLDRWIAKDNAIKEKLDEDGKKLFNQYDSDWCDRDHYRCIANFYLGFAAGASIGGQRR